jgi:hypothetical protein
MKTEVSRGSAAPLTTRACAEAIGFSHGWIRTAVDKGVTVRGRVVKLEAETIASGRRRRVLRIHADKFLDFLKAIGWQRLPILPYSLPQPTA